MPKLTIEYGGNLKRGSIIRALLAVIQKRNWPIKGQMRDFVSRMLMPHLAGLGIGKKRQNAVLVAIQRLLRNKSIEVAAINGTTYLIITGRGLAKLKRLELTGADHFSDKWDEIWRLIIFDIPEAKKTQRNYFARHLKHWGFKQLADSVYISPRPILDHALLLGQEIGIGENLHLIETSSIKSKSAMSLKNHFKL